MRKTYVFLISIVLVIAAVANIWITETVEASSNTLYVGGVGPGNYTSIQDAVDDASPGDAIYVYNGIYFENVVVNKAINLLGEEESTVTVDGGGGCAFNIGASYASVSGFTIANCNEGIYWGPNPNFVSIVNNTFLDSNDKGIYLTNSDSNIIDNNHFINNRYGITLYDSCDDNIIINNTVKWGDTGIYLWKSLSNDISKNIVKYAGNFGIVILDSTGNTVMDNTLDSNQDGIKLIEGANSNLVYNNNFFDNSQNAFDDGSNFWNGTYPSGGNYWDDYTGIDNFHGPNQDLAGSDGIGDTPYPISGGANQDDYPLMNPWTGTSPVPPLETAYVDDDYDASTPGWGYNHFDKIQDGIDAVSGSTVYVANGIYYEHVVIDKPLSLIGEDRDNTIIDGSGTGDVIFCEDVDGLTIENMGVTGSGTFPNTEYSDIKLFRVSNCTIKHNKAFDSNGAGIYIRGVEGDYQSYKNNKIIDNELINVYNRAIALNRCHNSIITNNTIDNSHYTGIRFSLSEYNSISKNTIKNCGKGAALNDQSHNNLFFENEFEGASIHFNVNCKDNQFYHNNIIGSSATSVSSLVNYWDDGYPSGGNYWSVYSGNDNFYGPNQDISGSDGIGDKPYSFTGGQDNYPLMNPSYYDTDLVAMWHFDEGTSNIAFDSSGNGNHGTIYGASWCGGISGNALDYDGLDDYVEINSLTSHINIVQTGTISAWIYRTSQSDTEILPQIFSAANDTDDDTTLNFGILQENDQDYLYIQLRDDHRNVCFHKKTISPLYLNKWHHVVAVQDGISIKLYVDGVEQNLIDVNGGGDSPGDWFADLGVNKPNLAQFGAHYEVDYPNPVYDYRSFFNGIIDEASIYLCALTANEIQNLYEKYPPDTVYVDDNFDASTPGWEYNHFDKIQDGIDAVSGSTVYVANGIYYEHIVIDKPLSLIGEDRENTIIDGSGTGDVIYVSGNYVNITEFTIRNSGNNWGDSAIETTSNNNKFYENIINNSPPGTFGIYLNDISKNNLIQDNQILGYNEDGIYLTDGSNYNEIYNNEISKNHDGIQLYDVIENIIAFNSIHNNSDDGIGISGSSNNNRIYSNLIENNLDTGITSGFKTNNNLIYHNNIRFNLVNGFDDSTNIWNNTYPTGGNYWDDYAGVDNFHGPSQDIPGSDNIGDTPYILPHAYNQDNYPFMTHLGWLNLSPFADFDYTPESPGVDIDVQFNDLSYDTDGVIVSWWWSFGDGYYSDLQNPMHSYYAKGIYDVTLTITDDADLINTTTKTIYVGYEPPIAWPSVNDDIKTDLDGDTVESFTFDGVDSYDPDGTITSYEWREGTTVLSTSISFTDDFTVGEHTIDLTVVDNDGLVDNDTIMITVLSQPDNVLPVADAGDDQTVIDNDENSLETVTLDGSGSYDTDGTIVSYEWTYNSGVIDNTMTFDYDFNIGTHNVELNVTDDRGGFDLDTVQITVNEKPPIQEIWSDDFSTGDFSKWTYYPYGGSGWKVISKKAVSERSHSKIYKRLDLSGYESVNVSFRKSLATSLEGDDYLECWIYKTYWNKKRLGRWTGDDPSGWTNEKFEIPVDYLVSGFRLEFYSVTDWLFEKTYLDDVLVEGEVIR